MSESSATVTIHIRPSEIAAWYHHMFTRPIYEIDGRESPARWGVNQAEVATGTHRINVFFRYRRQRSGRLGESAREFVVDEGRRRVNLRAKLGPRNGSVFKISQD